MPARIYIASSANNNHQNGDEANDAHHEDAGAQGHDSDGSDSDPPSDATSDLEQVAEDDFPNHFSERAGRLFHASSTSPYPLPVDTPEQERMKLLHDMLRHFIGAHYVGPVPETLALEQGSTRRKISLDVCTGKGDWVIDMVQEFPHVRFRGFDIVPIATRYPPRNVQFEIDDVNTSFRWHDGTFDLVNARFVAMATRDYPRILGEVARVLRPGGLFVSYEWGLYPIFDASFTNRNLATHAPAAFRLHNAVDEALLRRGIAPIASRVPLFIERLGMFTEISRRENYIPIGAWTRDPAMRSIGATCLEAHIRYSSSIKTLLIEGGWAEGDVQDMASDYIQEIRTVHGLVDVLYTVHARRA